MTVKQVQTDKFIFLGVSKTGESHINSGKTNQDAVEFFEFGDTFVIAVSDGLGSCERSHIGSQMAAHICEYILLEILDEKIGFECESIAQRVVELWAQAFPESIAKKYSSTLKAVFVKGNEIIAISIGDGFLYILTGGETLYAPFFEGDFVNETACLSHKMQSSELWSMKFSKKGETVIFVCTDGVSSGISEGRENELVTEILATKSLHTLKLGIKNMLNEMDKYNADDKTVGVVKL